MIKNTFHHGSTINTLLAIVRFNPVDVAFRDKRSTVYAFSFLKFSITFYLLFIFIDPVMIRCSILFYESISAIKFIISIHYVNTKHFSHLDFRAIN